MRKRWDSLFSATAFSNLHFIFKLAYKAYFVLSQQKIKTTAGTILFMTYWALFGSLILLICNRRSCAQVHKLSWSHWQIGNDQEGTLSFFLTTYIFFLDTFLNKFKFYIQSKLSGSLNFFKIHFSLMTKKNVKGRAVVLSESFPTIHYTFNTT